MSEEPPPGVLSGLPRSRPHRRSDKRPARAAPATAEVTPSPEARPSPERQPEAGPSPERQPKPATARRKPAAQPKARPRAAPKPRRTTPAPPSPQHQHALLGTAVQAAAELAEIGLMAGARALRGAVSRLPRP